MRLVAEGDLLDMDGWRMTVSPAREESFTLSLRIPAWSEKTTVKVNGEAVEEDYLDVSTNNKLDFIGPQTVPANCLFVLGDNRNASTDSRDKRIGMVDKRLVIGKVLLVVYPFSDFGGVE